MISSPLRPWPSVGLLLAIQILNRVLVSIFYSKICAHIFAISEVLSQETPLKAITKGRDAKISNTLTAWKWFKVCRNLKLYSNWLSKEYFSSKSRFHTTYFLNFNLCRGLLPKNFKYINRFLKGEIEKWKQVLNQDSW